MCGGCLSVAYTLTEVRGNDDDDDDDEIVTVVVDVAEDASEGASLHQVFSERSNTGINE